MPFASESFDVRVFQPHSCIKRVLLKTLSNNSSLDNVEKQRSLLSELSLLNDVVSFVHVFSDPPTIVLEALDTTLQALFEQFYSFSWPEIRMIISPLLNVLCQMHKLGYFFCCLNANSVLINIKDCCISDVKIADPELYLQHVHDSSFVETIYLAPEGNSFNSIPILTKSSDVYAFGILFIGLLLGRDPASVFSHDHQTDNSFSYDYLKRLGLHEELLELIHSMLQTDPNLRPEIHEVKEHLNELFESGVNYCTTKDTLQEKGDKSFDTNEAINDVNCFQGIEYSQDLSTNIKESENSLSYLEVQQPPSCQQSGNLLNECKSPVSYVKHKKTNHFCCMALFCFPVLVFFFTLIYLYSQAQTPSKVTLSVCVINGDTSALMSDVTVMLYSDGLVVEQKETNVSGCVHFSNVQYNPILSLTHRLYRHQFVQLPLGPSRLLDHSLVLTVKFLVFQDTRDVLSAIEVIQTIDYSNVIFDDQGGFYWRQHAVLQLTYSFITNFSTPISVVTDNVDVMVLRVCKGSVYEFTTIFPNLISSSSVVDDAVSLLEQTLPNSFYVDDPENSEETHNVLHFEISQILSVTPVSFTLDYNNFTDSFICDVSMYSSSRAINLVGIFFLMSADTRLELALVLISQHAFDDLSSTPDVDEKLEVIRQYVLDITFELEVAVNVEYLGGKSYCIKLSYQDSSTDVVIEVVFPIDILLSAKQSVTHHSFSCLSVNNHEDNLYFLLVLTDAVKEVINHSSITVTIDFEEYYFNTFSIELCFKQDVIQFNVSNVSFIAEDFRTAERYFLSTHNNGMAISSNRLWSWGGGSHGQVAGGRGTCPTNDEFCPYTWSNVMYPQSPLSLDNVKAVAMAEVASLILLTNGSVLGAGDSSTHFGAESTLYLFDTPTLVLDLPFTDQVFGSFRHYAALCDGTVYMFGTNQHGQLGLGHTANTNTPTALWFGNTSIEMVATGVGHTLLLTNLGEIYAMGSNAFGQLGYVGSSVSLTPKRILSLDDVIDIAAGHYSSYAVTGTGLFLSWGQNINGQLCRTVSSSQHRPQIVPYEGFSIHSLYSRRDVVLLLTTSGKLYGCGANSNRLLSPANVSIIDYLTRITELEGIKSVTLSYSVIIVTLDNYSSLIWGLGYKFPVPFGCHRH
ncbi:hypothetical protein RCL1_004192 [Eukaryota sp. TZLM3-RCL]